MFYLEISYQNGEWKPLHDINEPFKDVKRASRRAARLSASIPSAFIRVVDNRGKPFAMYLNNKPL